MPGRTAGQFPFIYKDNVFPSHFSQMISGAAADNSTTDDYNLSTVLHGYDSSVWCYELRVAGMYS